jgi:hypothetical protein
LGGPGGGDRPWGHAQIPRSWGKKSVEVKKAYNYMRNMSTTPLKRPKNLSKIERKHWTKVVHDLTGLGIDPATRADLIVDYVRLSARVERLTRREDEGMDVTRAINTAVAERRRLHGVIFAGAPEPEVMPTPAEIRASEADWAWYEFYESGLAGPEREAREAELMRMYGEPSMKVLVIPLRSSRAEAQAYFDLLAD